MNPNELSYSEVIFAYTRVQALADGMQVDVSSLAAEAGIFYPGVYYARCL